MILLSLTPDEIAFASRKGVEGGSLNASFRMSRETCGPHRCQ
jgi:hypothetical protein